MRRLGLWMVLVAAALACTSACGGGGGGGGRPMTTADLGGTWLGPTGTATPAGELTAPAAPGGMMADMAGNVTGTGTLSGLTGTISDQDPLERVFRFTGTGASTGVNGFLLASADRDHVLFVASDGTFGAWERNGALLQPPYLDTQFRNLAWSGTSTRVDATFQAVDYQPELVTIDALGIFTVGTTTTNLQPLTVFDVNTGEIRGDYTDPGPPLETGNVLMLLTPDRAFLGVLACSSTALSLTDCGFVALGR